MPTVWDDVLARLRVAVDAEDFRRWFGSTAYASDSGDQISVWVPAASDGRHILQNYNDRIQRVLRTLGRTDTAVRFIATGYADDEDDEEDEKDHE